MTAEDILKICKSKKIVERNFYYTCSYRSRCGHIDKRNRIRQSGGTWQCKNRGIGATLTLPKTLVAGAVAAFGVYQQAKANSAQQAQAAPSYANNVPQREMLIPPEPFFSVDRNSVLKFIAFMSVSTAGNGHLRASWIGNISGRQIWARTIAI